VIHQRRVYPLIHAFGNLIGGDGARWPAMKTEMLSFSFTFYLFESDACQAASHCAWCKSSIRLVWSLNDQVYALLDAFEQWKITQMNNIGKKHGVCSWICAWWVLSTFYWVIKISSNKYTWMCTGDIILCCKLHY